MRLNNGNKTSSALIGRLSLIDCVPQPVQVACHHGDTQTNKPTKRDGRVEPLISPLHTADKASAGPTIDSNILSTFYFQIYFKNIR